MQRREWLVWTAALPWSAAAADSGAVARRLKAGGVVIAFRHALAPGTFDPPGFALGDCGTQRNLNEAGRAQAQRIGEWFRSHQLDPAEVRSSPWCRCLDTARLAFGRGEAWPALGSPYVGTEQTNESALSALRGALLAATAQPGRFEVWVTHQFVLSALVGGGDARSGEGLLLAAGPGGRPTLIDRLDVPA